MKRRIALLSVLFSFAGICYSVAQESVAPDSLMRNRDRDTTLLLFVQKFIKFLRQ